MKRQDTVLIRMTSGNTKHMLQIKWRGAEIFTYVSKTNNKRIIWIFLKNLLRLKCVLPFKRIWTNQHTRWSKLNFFGIKKLNCFNIRLNNECGQHFSHIAFFSNASNVKTWKMQAKPLSWNIVLWGKCFTVNIKCLEDKVLHLTSSCWLATLNYKFSPHS